MTLTAKRGFALPTVLIASVVMLLVLTVAVTATTASRLGLQQQYYNQLASAAGDAGVAYAQACIAANGGVPTWSTSSPLQPWTDCNGNALTGLSNCPNSPRTAACEVTVNGDVVSSFSVGSPTLDGNGQATIIPNAGYVSILRTSNSTVVQTYQQPKAQPTSAPNLCQGQATTSLGWGNILTTTLASGVSAGLARSVTIASPAGEGQYYLWRDFSVSTAGTYNLSAYADDQADILIDGNYITTSANSLASASVSLTPGCHIIAAKVTNSLPGTSGLSLSLTLSGSTLPSVVSGSGWRVQSGPSVGFSDPRFPVTSSWQPVVAVDDISKDSGVYADPTAPDDWETVTPDHGYTPLWISTSTGASLPATSWAYFVDTNSASWNLSSSGSYTFYVACDDQCNLYIDGQIVASPTVSHTMWYSTTLPLAAGPHQLAVELYNSAAGRAAFVLEAVRSSDNTVVDTSNTASWLTTGTWYSSQQTFTGYDQTFTPTPAFGNVATVNAVVVGGGGAGGSVNGSSGRNGGGGGAGGVMATTTTVSPGTYSVVVGAGGSGSASTGGPAYGSAYGNGSPSSFNLIVATGGGGGGLGGAGGASPGGSGGGAGRGNTTTVGVGISGQGNNGGISLSTSTAATNGGAGGGGASGVGGNGSTSAGGNGGIGRTISVPGVGSDTLGGGGGGGRDSGGNPGAGGSGGGGGGAYPAGPGTAGTANTGGGGGGAANSTATYAGGAGGSGIVIIYFQSCLNIVASGGTHTTSGGYDVYVFNSSGTFTITSIGTSTC